MTRSVDVRNWKRNLAADRSAIELDDLSRSVTLGLPGAESVEIVELNAFTGTPSRLKSINGPTASQEPVSLINTAMQHVRTSAAALGFNSGSIQPEFVPDPSVLKTSAGASVVHLHQNYRGIPVFQMVRSVRFSPANRVTETFGDNSVLPADIDVMPKVAAATAVRFAAEFLADQPEDDAGEHGHDHWGQKMPQPELDVSKYQPEIVLGFELPSKATVISKGPFEEQVPVHLVIFDLGGRARLAWKALLTFSGYVAQYEVIVSADNPDSLEVLYSQSTMDSVAAKGAVFKWSPGVEDRQSVDFPLPKEAYPTADLISGPGFSDWVLSDLTVGNNVTARLCTNDSCIGGQSLQGAADGGTLTFDPAEAEGDDQKALNIFFFCNYMHDFLESLGFDEASGNFQVRNVSGTGAGGDPVDARSHAGAVPGTANMLTRPDGRPPVMNMGLVVNTGRHTAFDSDVVFHEYIHGLTNRLVGGRLNTSALQRPQSRGMGEGWGDYFALTVFNFDRANEKVVMGDWIVDDSTGIRAFPYDSAFPDNYGDLGTGRYALDFTGGFSEHAIGEIWCATLMEMNRRVEAALGDKKQGYLLCLQIVTDGLKMTPANPSFLDARNAILQALDDKLAAGHLDSATHQSVKAACWAAYAQFGMGEGAFSPGAGLSGIIADFSVPALFAPGS